MRQAIIWSAILLLSGVISSCCSTKKAESMKTEQKVNIPGPKIIIYKTKKDYSKLVPIILSDDKKSIESYPDVKDVYRGDSLAYPTRLHNDYWLDNRGINLNVAFISLTYEEYSKLRETPSSEELINMIIDSQPLVSMYSCGTRASYQDVESELNSKIDANDFSRFTKLK